MVDNWAANAQSAEVHPDPPSATSDPATTIRQRIAVILDALSALPRDEFAERADLAHERDTLTAELRRLSANDEITQAWTERAPYRSPDRGRPHIASHGEGGGSPA